jgi:hypothetical protein
MSDTLDSAYNVWYWQRLDAASSGADKSELRQGRQNFPRFLPAPWVFLKSAKYQVNRQAFSAY